MARRILHRLLTCDGCGDNILLPLEKLAQAFASQGVRTTDKEAIAAVCNRCKHVRNYDLANSNLSHTWGPLAYLDVFSGWVFVEPLKCADTACKASLPLFAIWNPAISPEERQAYAHTWKWDGVKCQGGHPIVKPK